MAIAIDYRITGAGWAECEISTGTAACTISASYLSDALGNLVLTAIAVVRGFPAVSFGFDVEPGEYRWTIRHVGAQEVHAAILEFDDLWANRPDGEGRELLSFSCDPMEFGKAVHDAARRVLDEHGAEGYRKAWIEHPFPEQLVEVLRADLERSKT